MKLVVKSTVLSLALLLSQAQAMEVAAVAPAAAVEVVAPVAQAVQEAAPVVAEAAKEAVAPVVEAAQNVASTVKASSFGAKVGEFFGSVKAKLPAMPSKAEAIAAIKNAPKATVEFAKAHPYKTAAIVAGTAAVVYAVYKVCTAKKAKTAKTK